MPRGLKVTAIALGAVLIAAVAFAGASVVWLQDRIHTTEYCATCHVMSPYYGSWKSSPFTAHAHANAGLTCQDCHTRTIGDGLRELLSNVAQSYELPLEDHTVRSEQCLRCHLSHEHLASRTQNLKGPDGFALGRNPHASHWGPLECGICHKMHKASDDFCSKCHGFPTSGPAWRASRPSVQR